MTARQQYPGTSPYTVRNIEPAIDHLEQVLSAEGADSLFSQAYWRVRVLQALATAGLLPNQRKRLQQLLDTIDRERAGTVDAGSP